MSDTETLATIRGEVSAFKDMIHECSLNGETEHSDIYLNVLEDEIRVVQSSGGEVVLTYGTYDDHFDDISLEVDETTREAEDGQGETFEFTTGVEAILNVSQTLDRLSLADGSGVVEFSLLGDPESRLAAQWKADGALTVWDRLPGSASDLDQVPQWLPQRFTDDNVYCNSAGDQAPTQVITDVEALQRVIRAADLNSTEEAYPVTVENGELYVSVGDDSGAGAKGQLPADSVEGPDVENQYLGGFEEALSVLSGRLQVNTAPGNAPVSLVMDRDGRTVRHVVGSVS